MQRVSLNAAKQVPVRLVYLGFGVAAFLLVYSAGASVDMSRAEAQDVAAEFVKHAQDIDQGGIFMNNIQIALGMFVPGVGAGLGGYAAFSTGMTFKALVIVNPVLSGISPLMVLATPFGVLEVLAYGLAMSRSAMLALQLATRNKQWRQFTLYTAVEMAIVVSALLIGAAIEGQVIAGK